MINGNATAGILIASQMAIYEIAARIPILRQAADRSLVRKLSRQLASYGHTDFTSNASAYRPAHA
jgi:hypothetical protein